MAHYNRRIAKKHQYTMFQYTADSRSEVIAMIEMQLAAAKAIWPCLSEVKIVDSKPSRVNNGAVSKEVTSASQMTSQEVEQPFIHYP